MMMLSRSVASSLSDDVACLMPDGLTGEDGQETSAGGAHPEGMPYVSWLASQEASVLHDTGTSLGMPPFGTPELLEQAFHGWCEGHRERAGAFTLLQWFEACMLWDAQALPEPYHQPWQQYADMPKWRALLMNTSLHRLTHDSRTCVQRGDVFFAMAGAVQDGHGFIPQVIAQGVRVVVVALAQWHTWVQAYPEVFFIPYYEVTTAYAASLAWYWGYAHEALGLYAVTGTNGKTTVSHLIASLLEGLERPCGLVGTLGIQCKQASDQYLDTGLTTPPLSQLYAGMAWARAFGCEAMAMEASSHALHQGRLAGCRFNVAVITNLTQDHLDYHGTMEAYFESKALLFRGLEEGAYAVLNTDDAWYEGFLGVCPEGVKVLTYGLNHPTATLNVLGEPKFTPHGSECYVLDRRTLKTYPLTLNLGGRFSLYNALAALLAVTAEAPECMPQAIEVLRGLQGVRGRFERVIPPPHTTRAPSSYPCVLIDYAHTPDGLDNVLQAARAICPAEGKLYALFGCGGDRDRTKRPKMARIAETLADVVCVTSDNPRTESPEAIIQEVLQGLTTPEKATVFPERREAIRWVLDQATSQDIVVIAGKGHETYQILADKTIHFDDREEVLTYWQKQCAL
ncbi:MAG: UDP-N-acetylmuramoyl-L-alanyl-D-glutamate--2,6-diaminopimelate ligase [Vampirovibrionales bacterium]